MKRRSRRRRRVSGKLFQSRFTLTESEGKKRVEEKEPDCGAQE